jgi:hypothetical protein
MRAAMAGMDLKKDFLAALNCNAPHESLLQLVQRHQAQGLTPEESYEVLQQIWLEFGFNESDDNTATRENLEYLMEKVWFQGAH